MRTRPLGDTGLEVSEVSFGAWAIGGPAMLEGRAIGWGTVDDDASIRAIHRALDRGVTLLDTADVYGWGHSEEVVGRALEGRRDRVVLATKVGNRRDAAPGSGGKDFSPAWIRQACEASLRRLQTDWIDLYQLHSPHASFDYPDETWNALERLRDQGKVRVVGVSVGNSSPHHVAPLLEDGRARVLQVQMNALRPAPALGMLEPAARAGVGILARVPLASGLLAAKIDTRARFAEDDWRARWVRSGELADLVERARRVVAAMEGDAGTPAQRALRFLLAFPQVSSVLAGARTETQAEENAEASALGPLDPARVRAVLAIAEETSS